MLTRPDDVADADVVGALGEGWGLPVEEIDHAAVGFGSHHWQAAAGPQRWFVTVDDLEALRCDATDRRTHAADRLAAALSGSRALRDAGLEFVVAPIPTLTGEIFHPIDDRYVLALYPHVDGEAHSWGPYPTGSERRAVLDRLIALHRVEPSIAPTVRSEDFAIPVRDALVEGLVDDRPWGPGPYAESAREVVLAHRDSIRRRLVDYDELVVEVSSTAAGWVLTHGEPHRGNTIDTPAGVVLIDWDTLLRAPRERDLWMLVAEDPQMAVDYEARTGIRLDDAALDVHRRWWELCDMSRYTAELRRPHRDTADVRVMWEQLERYLDQLDTP